MMMIVESVSTLRWAATLVARAALAAARSLFESTRDGLVAAAVVVVVVVVVGWRASSSDAAPLAEGIGGQSILQRL